MKTTYAKRKSARPDRIARRGARPHSTGAGLVLGLALASLPAPAALPIVYDSNNGSPDPRTQGWSGFEIVIRGDTNSNGLVDSPGNTGPVAGPGEYGLAWQLHDQRTEAAVNSPRFETPLDPSDQGDLLAKGWVFSVRVNVARNGSGASFDSFVAWGLTNFMGSDRRVGFAIGADANNKFFVREDTGSVSFPAQAQRTAASDYHTLMAYGFPGQTTYDWYLDGTYLGTRDLLDNTVSNGGVVRFQSGSSPLINAASNWLTVSLDTWTPKDVAISLPDGTARNVVKWLPPAPAGTYPVTYRGSSGTLAFTSLPVVDANGTLHYTPAAGTSGTAAFDIETPHGTERFHISAGKTIFGETPADVRDYTAGQFLTDGAKSARIRSWRHAPGTRKGIAILLVGFSSDIPTFSAPAGDTTELVDFGRTIFSEGFDVIEVHWHDPRTYIEDNAMIVVELLQALAGGGFNLDPGGSDYIEALTLSDRVVLVGQSMGGLVSRFALCYLDSNVLPYRCDLFVSVDSPQEGANIPIGLQRLAQYLNSLPSSYTSGIDSSSLTSVLDSMDQPAPRQMLVLHHSRANNVGASHAAERDTFLNLLQSVDDWPTNPGLRMAAIANGRGDGTLQAGDLARTEFDLPKSNYLTLDWNASTQVIHDATTFINAPTCFVGNLRVRVTGGLRMRSFAINPASNPGTSVIFRGDSTVGVSVWGTEYDIFGDPTNVVHFGSGVLDTTGSEATVKTRLRNFIKANGTPNGLTCGLLDSGIDSAIDGFIDQLMEAETLNQVHTASGAFHWEHVPGAFRPTGQNAAGALGSAGSVAFVSPYHTFIPTVSALGISGSVLAHSVVIPDDAVDDSPFHALYHFGSHRNTGHLENYDGWLSDILAHELRMLCNEFELELGDGPDVLAWRGRYLLEENPGLVSGWLALHHQSDGVYPIPAPIPSHGFYRLRFSWSYQ